MTNTPKPVVPRGFIFDPWPFNQNVLSVMIKFRGLKCSPRATSPYDTVWHHQVGPHAELLLFVPFRIPSARELSRSWKGLPSRFRGFRSALGETRKHHKSLHLASMSYSNSLRDNCRNQKKSLKISELPNENNDTPPQPPQPPHQAAPGGFLGAGGPITLMSPQGRLVPAIVVEARDLLRRLTLCGGHDVVLTLVVVILLRSLGEWIGRM